MFVILSMTVLCTSGVTFYVRFLVALCKECRHQRISYVVRLQPESLEHIIPEARELETSIPRAA